MEEEESTKEGVVWLVTPNPKLPAAEWKTTANFPNCTRSEAAAAASNNAGGVVLCMECGSDKRCPNHQIDNPAGTYAINTASLHGVQIMQLNLLENTVQV